jgi:hypothetical protein
VHLEFPLCTTSSHCFPPSTGSRVQAVEIAGAMSGCSPEDLLFDPEPGADSPHDYGVNGLALSFGQELLPQMDMELCPIDETLGGPSHTYEGESGRGEVPQTPSFIHFDMPPTSPFEATTPASLRMPPPSPRGSPDGRTDPVVLFDGSDISFAPTATKPRSPDSDLLDTFMALDISPVEARRRPAEAFHTPSFHRGYFGAATRTPDYTDLLFSPTTLDESLDKRSPHERSSHPLSSPFTSSLTNTLFSPPALFAITVTPASARQPLLSPSPLPKSPADFLRASPSPYATAGRSLRTSDADDSPVTPGPAHSAHPSPSADSSTLDHWTVCTHKS